MKVQVSVNNVKIIEQSILNENEYNIHECEFEFTEEYNGLTKKAVFTNQANETYVETIVDDKCSIPSEVLKDKENVKLGVYAYDVENEELLLRYSPRPTEFYVHEGSYKEGQNSTPPTPSEVEQLQAQITSNKNDIEEMQGDIVDINSDIVDIKAEQTEQNTKIQNNTDNISTINGQITTINQDINNLEETKADKLEIPTKTSDLINDSDFVSDSEYVHTDNNFTNEKDAQITTNTSNITTLQNTKADKTEIPTKTSQLTNDSGFITKNVNDLANYYKKSETYNKTEIDGKVSSVYKYKGTVATYQDLPSTDLTIGDVYNVEEDGSNYAWTGNSWDKLGGDIDLSEYYTKTQTDSLLSAKANSNDVYSKTETDTLLNNKADKSEIPDLTDYVKNTDYATASKGGVLKTGFGLNVRSTYGDVFAEVFNYNTYQNKSNENFISKGTLENVIAGKELINQTQLEESQATQDTEIEALQNQVTDLEQDVEDLRGACYKVEGTGTDITLNNTAQGRLLKNELSGRTEQESLSGKNLLNVDSNLSWTGTKEVMINLEEGQYIISLENWSVDGTNNSSVISIGGSSYDLNNSNKTRTITVSSSITKLYLYSYYNYASSVGITATIKNLMIRKASVSDASYEPYCGGIPAPNPDFPQQIKNVTGNANEKIQNKNLFDYTKYLNLVTNYEYEDGVYHCKSILLKPNTQYTVSFPTKEATSIVLLINNTPHVNDIGYFDTRKTSDTKTFTTDSTGNLYIGVLYSSDSAVNDLLQNLKLQIEEGSTATPYVPHQEQNYPFTFAEGQFLAEDGELTVNGIQNQRSKYIFTGNEGWQSYTPVSTGLLTFRLRFPLKAINKCNYFTVTGNEKVQNGQMNNKTYNYNNLEVVNTDCENVASFKAWLAQKYASENPVEMEYTPNTTPEIIPYNETQVSQYEAIQNARSNDDITYITSESDELGFNMNVESLGNINKVINNLLNN